MLKIKDSVDLKELEKFGFKFNGGTSYLFESGGSFIECSDCDLKRLTISIDIWCYEEKREEEIFNKVFDLVTANMVEKVEDK